MRNARFIIVTGALAALVITGLSLFVLPTYWGAARIDDALKQPTTTIDTSQNNASTSTTPPTTASVDKLVEIAKAKSEADNRVRELGLKVAAGIGAITAALVGWGRLELSRNEARLAESGHVTERFTKAIEQLGNGSLDIRLGGIYALERIARDSGRDRPVVFEVLTAFVREHAGAEVDDPTSPEPKPVKPFRQPTDVQACMTVLGRHTQYSQPVSFDLNKVGLDLRGINLIAANLRGVNLSGANLDWANLAGANLAGANLFGANLAGAYLFGANLSGAYLREADLSGANLSRANLSEANLSEANLFEADLGGAHLGKADLSEADLVGANLSRAYLSRVNLSGARYSAETVWADGFDPVAAGAVLLG